MTASEAQFQELLVAAYEELPEAYREACEGMAIRAQALPSADTLAALEIDDPYELLGLYHGLDLARKSNFAVAMEPDVIVLYREPIIAYAKTNGFELADVVRHVLVHEIGHHFGMSDDDMEAIEARARD